MLTLVLIILLAGMIIALLLTLHFLLRRISQLERSLAEIEVEEDRVFDFLHGLGEAFSEGVRSADLHRLIVEGAKRILDAHGGALYLVGKNKEILTPVFISKGCPPLVEVPPHIMEQAAVTPVALESYLRLHGVRQGEGILGEVWRDQKPQLVNSGRLARSEVRSASAQATSIMAAPLVYRRQVLGVLALANGAMSTPFNNKDFEVFKNITEQSSFALYNEVVYEEASEKRKIDNDLRIAAEIQSILLPAEAPKCEGFEIMGVNIPARHVSGDYYDYLSVAEDATGVVIADVSGKGVPASLIMAMCRSVLRSHALGEESPSATLRRINRQLYPDIKEDMFISMAYVILKSGSSELRMARAGHDAPLLYRAKTREVETLKPSGMALGIDSGDVFDRVCTDFTFVMDAGDCLLLYTDGATEALDQNGLEYGLPRVVQSLQAGAPNGAAEVIRTLSEDLRAFAGNHAQHDDITLIAIRKL